MKLLKDRIIKDGIVLYGDVLKVDSFLNHQIDIDLLSELGREWYNLFKDAGVTKIMTIEASGIALACVTAQYFGVPVVYAKKSRASSSGPDYYSTRVVSYTHGQSYEVTVAKKFINKDDRILLIDDFLAHGSALKVLINLAEMGGATIVGAGVAIEKAYQNGGADIRSMGYRVESLASIIRMTNDGKIEFSDD